MVRGRTKGRSSADIEDGYIDDVDRSLDPYARFLRHNHMHAGVVPMVLDEFGRCAYCVKKGYWRPDA